MKYLKYDAPDLHFCIKLADNTTAVFGDGNTGKTCIFNKLIEAVNRKEISDDFLFINMRMLYNIKMLKQYCDALFIIDDFDAIRILRPEIVEILNYSINQVLVFGRNIDGLRIDKHYLYCSEREGSKLIFNPVQVVSTI